MEWVAPAFASACNQSQVVARPLGPYSTTVSGRVKHVFQGVRVIVAQC
jgi:hypothetical protein